MHTIRLRGPWQKTLVGDAQPVRVTVPETLPNSSAGACYQRAFNCPTGIDESRVFLNVESWRGQLVAVAVNDRPMPISEPPLRVEITDQLQSHNTLTIHLQQSAESGASLDGEVALQIESEGE